MSKESVRYSNFKEFKYEILKIRKERKLHSISEENLKNILLEIYPGTYSVCETNVNGGREDLNFFIPPLNYKVHFEIFASKSQVPQDLRLLENSKSDLQIAIIIDKEIDPKVIEEYYRKKPDNPFICFKLSELFLEESIEEFKDTLKEKISEILDLNPTFKDYNKIFRQSDEAHEFIYPNIFQFTKYPKVIRSYISNFNSKMEIIKDIIENYGDNIEILPFIFRENRIYSFFDLMDDTIFKNYINKEINANDLDIWLDDYDKRRWIIELINVFIKSYCIQHKDLEFDGEKKRYYFCKREDTLDKHEDKKFLEEDDDELEDIEDDEIEDEEGIVDMKTIRYFTGIRHQIRRLYWSKKDYYVHLAFKLRVITFEKDLHLMILPTFVFTTDGTNLIPPESRSGLYARYRNKQHNPSILNSIRFILSYFSDLEDYTKNLEFKIKDVSFEIENRFKASRIQAGNPEDYRDIYNILIRKVERDD